MEGSVRSTRKSKWSILRMRLSNSLRGIEKLGFEALEWNIKDFDLNIQYLMINLCYL